MLPNTSKTGSAPETNASDPHLHFAFCLPNLLIPTTDTLQPLPRTPAFLFPLLFSYSTLSCNSPQLCSPGFLPPSKGERAPHIRWTILAHTRLWDPGSGRFTATTVPMARSACPSAGSAGRRRELLSSAPASLHSCIFTVHCWPCLNQRVGF